MLRAAARYPVLSFNLAPCFLSLCFITLALESSCNSAPIGATPPPTAPSQECVCPEWHMDGKR